MEQLEELTIGKLAEKAGVTPRTIRFYIEEGLLPPGYVAGRQNLYGYEHYIRLKAIKKLQELDMPLKKIKAYLEGMSIADMEKLLNPHQKFSPFAAPERFPGHMETKAFSRTIEFRTLLSALEREFLNRSAQVKTYITTQTPSKAEIGLWRKVALAPGVELLYQITDDQEKMARIQKIVQDAVRTLSSSTPSGVDRKEDDIQ